MRGALLLIIVVAIVAFVVDALTNKCVQRSWEAAAVTGLHHLIFVFALLGWLLDDFAALLVYVSLPLLVHLHWKTNSNSCFIDEVTQSTCGTKQGFYHLGRQVRATDTLITACVAIGVLIALVKLYKILRCRPRGPPPSVPPPWCASKRCSVSAKSCGAPYASCPAAS
jgi:hypothetical protein